MFLKNWFLDILETILWFIFGGTPSLKISNDLQDVDSEKQDADSEE